MKTTCETIGYVPDSPSETYCRCGNCEWVGPESKVEAKEHKYVGDPACLIEPEQSLRCPVCDSDKVDEYEPIQCAECFEIENECICEEENFEEAA